MPRARRESVQQYYAAWIALLSMLLLVIAPVISQLQMGGPGGHHHSPQHSRGAEHWRGAEHSRGAAHTPGRGYSRPATHESASVDRPRSHTSASGHDEHHTLLIASAPHSDPHAHHDPLSHVLEACGYCFLLANSPALVEATSADPTGPLVPVRSIGPRSAWQAPRAAPYVPHRPRGPPSPLAISEPSSSSRVFAFA